MYVFFTDKKSSNLSEIFSFEINFRSLLAPKIAFQKKSHINDELQSLASDFAF